MKYWKTQYLAFWYWQKLNIVLRFICNWFYVRSSFEGRLCLLASSLALHTFCLDWTKHQRDYCALWPTTADYFIFTAGNFSAFAESENDCAHQPVSKTGMYQITVILALFLFLPKCRQALRINQQKGAVAMNRSSHLKPWAFPYRPTGPPWCDQSNRKHKNRGTPVKGGVSIWHREKHTSRISL